MEKLLKVYLETRRNIWTGEKGMYNMMSVSLNEDFIDDILEFCTGPLEKAIREGLGFLPEQYDLDNEYLYHNEDIEDTIKKILDFKVK